MANHGAGNKFVSVNLNKSYGKFTGPSNSSSYGARVRSGGQVGGGMVVLSRPKSSQKPGQKLSVPSPVNLPSMRKEHEKFDSSGAGGASAGSNTRPSSGGMRWTKPAVIVVQEKSVETQSDVVGETVASVEGGRKLGSVYLPPARSGSMVDTTSSSQPRSYTPVEKVAILRGEDFPSLHTSLSTSSGNTHKLKDVANQKSKQLPADDLSNKHLDTANIGMLDMLPQRHTSKHIVGYDSTGNDVGGSRIGGLKAAEESQKHESYLHGSLPEFRVNPRSDWADDERDTGRVFTDRSGNYGTLNNEGYRDRDFEMPRGSYMLSKPAPNVFNKWGQRDSETGKMLSSEVFKANPFVRDVRPTSREGQDRNSWNHTDSHGEGRDISSWRSSSVSFTRAMPQEHMKNGSGFGEEPFSGKRELSNDKGFVATSSLDRKNLNPVEGGRQRWNNNVEHSAVQGSDRHRNNNYHNTSPAKSTLSFGGKGLPVNDPILNFSKVKRPLLNAENLSLEDAFPVNGYDGRDPFSGGLVGVVKRKKDLPKLTELHDPARESFEAELERVQKMQEQERQRAIEEQERAMHLARIEEEERLKHARELEETKRRMEDEAREAAWRAEQEQRQAKQKAEEQRMAREEEKQRMQMEEERRKQAANQKLLELEEKIARRQAETTREGGVYAVDETSDAGKFKETSRVADISDWEDGERMVERITTSASSDSSGMNRFVDFGSRRPSFAGNSVLPGSGKSINSQRREAYEYEGSSNFALRNQESNPGRDFPLQAKKPLTRKDVYGGSGFMYPYPQNYAKAGVLDPEINDPYQTRGQKWSFPGDANPEIDNIHDRFSEKLGDAGWGGNTSSHPSHYIYQESSYQNPESGEVHSYSRSRYSMRQPRVLPPPSISSMNKNSIRDETERPAITAALDRTVDSSYVRDSGMQTGYDNVRQENIENPEMVAFPPGQVLTNNQLLEGNGSVRCDSQSSLSVTSPPSSPAYLSHDDLEDSRGTPGSSAEAVVMSSRSGPADDEEWAVENRINLQQQEVYDEGVEYQEGDEVHAEEAADIDLNEEFEGFSLYGKDSPHVSENLILGFNEGVEVGMPSDESESNQNENNKFTASLSFTHADSLQSDRHMGAQSSTEMQMIEGQPGELAVQSNVDPPTSAGLVEATVSCGEPLLTFATPPVSQTATSSMHAAPYHPDMPVKLQFGLFTGPSLTPSPVPSIQIGSIQMPLHLHPPVGSSLPNQSGPLFHFGQLRYNTPIAHGILPLAPQAISIVQPSVPGQFANQATAPAGPMSIQRPSQPQFANSRDALVKHQESSTPEDNSLQVQGKGSSGGPSSSNNSTETDNRHGLGAKMNDQLQRDSTLGDFMSSKCGGPVRSQIIPPQRLSRERVMVRSKAPGPVSGGRGRESFSTLRSFGTNSSSSAFVAKLQHNGQHMQINSHRRPAGPIDKMSFGPRGTRMSSRNGSRKGVFLEKQASQTIESKLPISGAASINDVTSGSKFVEGIGSNSSIAGQNASQNGEGHHKRNIQEAIDVTLQSGVVRVYDQPGIEVPSDKDDFIEVRSKRQVLNDRREQREKDNMAKFRVTKNMLKPRLASQTRTPRNSNKLSSSLDRGLTHKSQASFVAIEGRNRVNDESSAGIDSTSVAQPLAPIGTPSTHNDISFEGSQSVKPVHASRLPVVSTSGEVGPGTMNENKSKSVENVEESLGPWNNFWVSQQVMPLTPSQLKDDMNPVQLDAYGSYSGLPSESICVPVSSSSSLNKDKSVSASASPVNSLLAGKKIQFGAVTSPSVPSPCDRAINQAIGFGQLDQVSHESSASKNVHSLPIAPDKHPKESRTHLEMSDIEAKAAASAVDVATSDILGTGTSRDSEDLKQATDDGTSNDQKSLGQSRNEESLSVSLPADLSIEMSPISVWQPMQSPQNAPHHMLSHFPGGHPSHFPFYDMNPMVSGPVFTVGLPDNASGSQIQSQNNNTAMSGPPGPWQQSHPRGDSFYGHPAGFPPFISTPQGIPGPQGPPQMLLYNQFAPVGQLGQVGLSFMGTTYVPSGKQPDWKHKPTSSAMAVGEEAANNVEVNTGHHTAYNIPAPIQHFASGHSLHPVAPSLALFDVSRYQQSSDMSGPARWSHVPQQHLHSMPQMLQLQPHPESLMHLQHINEPPPDNSTASSALSRIPNSESVSGNNFPSSTSSAPVAKFSAELGLVESSGSAKLDPSVSRSSGTTVDASKIGSSEGRVSNESTTSMRSRPNQYKPIQHNNHSGYSHYKGGGSSQRNNSGGEWPNRRAGYHSRNQSSGTEKSHHSVKVKQIYVPKQPAATS